MGARTSSNVSPLNNIRFDFSRFFFLPRRRRYYDTNVLAYQSARIPEQIRLKVGGITAAQFSVYDEFARNIPGFQPLSERDAAMFVPKSTISVSATQTLRCPISGRLTNSLSLPGRHRARAESVQ